MKRTHPELPKWKSDYIKAMMEIADLAERVMTKEEVAFLGRFLWGALNRNNRQDKQTSCGREPKEIVTCTLIYD